MIHKKELRMIDIRTLNNIKERGLFKKKWSNLFALGLYQYTEKNLLKVDAIFIKLIDELIEMGSKANEDKMVEKFKTAVIELNILNAEIDETLIETGERDDLCLLFISIAKAVQIDLSSYNNQDITFQWREW